MSTDLTYRALVGDALDALYRALHPFVEREMRAVYGDRWLREARAVLHNKPLERWDTSDLLTLLYSKFFHIFRGLGHDGRSRASLLKEVRKKWAHQGSLTLEETRRALEHTILLLRAVGAGAEAQRLEPQVLALMQQELRQKHVPAAAPAGRPHPEGAVEGEGGGSGDLFRRGLRRLKALGRREAVEPLEIRRAVLDEVERAVEPLRRDGAFNRLVVHVLAGDGPTRLLFEAALDGPEEPFREAVHRRLAEACLPVPAGLHVSWKLHRTAPQKLAERFAEKPFCVELHRRRVQTSATLAVEAGAAPRAHYVLRSGSLFTVGRLPEVVDERGRLVRRNTLAFLDYEDPRLSEAERKVQATVSRVHAHICFDPAAAVFQLVDDQSTWGTAVVREGYPVPIQVKQRPVALQDGDLLYFGKACARFSMGRPRGRG